jgi:hypothetical protein
LNRRIRARQPAERHRMQDSTMQGLYVSDWGFAIRDSEDSRIPRIQGLVIQGLVISD